MSGISLVKAPALVQALKEALGLHDRAVRRVVLDFDISQPVKVYVEEFALADKADKFAALFAELPKVKPFVQFVDRVEVDNAGGTAVEIKHVKCEDDEARSLCLKLLDIERFGTDEDKAAVRKALYERGVTG